MNKMLDGFNAHGEPVQQAAPIVGQIFREDNGRLVRLVSMTVDVPTDGVEVEDIETGARGLSWPDQLQWIPTMSCP